MIRTPEEDTVIFRTEEGDYDVSLFSTDGQLKYSIAQKAIAELRDLTDQMVIRREAITSLHAAIQEVECTEENKVKLVRATTETGQYKPDDLSTPDINEAYVKAPDYTINYED